MVLSVDPITVSVPEILGKVVFTGTEVNTTVWFEVADVGPVTFVAVTMTRNVVPTSVLVVT